MIIAKFGTSVKVLLHMSWMISRHFKFSCPNLTHLTYSELTTLVDQFAVSVFAIPLATTLSSRSNPEVGNHIRMLANYELLLSNDEPHKYIH